MGSLPSKRSRPSVHSLNIQPTQMVNKCVLVALYDFPSGGQAETIIRMGERLNVLSEDGEWWNVASVASGKECYIPSNYVAKVFHSWLYEGISREKAEELLLFDCNHGGAFMIRESQTRKGGYSLSIRRTSHASWDSIKHYRINRLENGWLYISPRLTFSTLHELVEYYSELPDGLCCSLKEPCFIEGSRRIPASNLPEPVIVKKPELNWKDLDSAVLFKEGTQLEEESPVSLGLREAISSYLFMTDGQNLI
ncbi:src-like-adapter 2 [Lissotriton helveticus]